LRSHRYPKVPPDHPRCTKAWTWDWFDEADAHRVSTKARFRNPQPVPTTSAGFTTPPFSHPFQESRFTTACHQPEPMESFRLYCAKKSSFKTDWRS
jgi:hypothetical protein